jgi:uncharacterized SAM-binding protein YcdF (DUF218 family)
MYSFLVWELFQPFTLLYLLTLFALVNLWRKRRETRRRLLWLTIPFAALTLACLPAFGYLLTGSLEWPYPPLEQRPADAEAIVVLASYIFAPDAVRLRPEMDEDTFNRCLRAAELYHEGPPCPVVVSGGASSPTRGGPTNAEVMRTYLLQLGVKDADVLVEGASRSTYENAAASGQLLAERGIHKIILVTSVTHLIRAAGCFRKQGLEVVPCGCRYRATEFQASLAAFLPKASAAQACERACHEWLGVLWYWLRGRL